MPATPAKKVPAKKVAPRPLTSAPAARKQAPSTTTLNDAADIVEKTEGDKITLAQDLRDPEIERVTVVVPHRFTLTRDDRTPVVIMPGVQEMALDDAAHWYSRANGVKVYSPD